MSSITDSILGADSNSPSLELPELEEMLSFPDESVSSGDESSFSSTTTWLLISLFLGFVGFIIYGYLAKENGNSITDVLSSLKSRVTNLFQTTDSSQTITQTSTSSEQEDEMNSPTEQPEPSISHTKTTTQDITTAFPEGDVAQANALNKAINTSTSQKQQFNGEDYQADDSSSTIQKGVSKAGFCYIGEDRGFRTCAEVGVNDTCMSGEIFPTRDVCVNPKLRV